MSQVVSKAEFSRLKGVSAARVSQWISSGKIDGPAMVGQGRGARIDVAIADEQLKQRLDLSQRIGNGLATRIGETSAAALAPIADAPQLGLDQPVLGPAAPSAIDTIEEAFKRQKLEGLQRENRKRAEEEAARAGRYVDAQAASRQIAKVAGKTMTMIDGALPEIASAVAAKFSLSQRDVLHLLRAEFRDLRQRAAGALRSAAAELPMAVEVDVADESVAA